MLQEGQVGIQLLNDGANQTIRLTKLAAQVVQELHGRFYEQTYRGNVFTYGIGNTALVGATNSVSTLGATCQPVIGLWNPLTSPNNLVILQVCVNTTTIANTAVSPAGFMYCTSTGNSAITTGSSPVNAKLLSSPGGSVAKCFSVSTALTGMANSLTVMRNSAITSVNVASGAATAATIMPTVTVENIDGGLIVPPGGVLALLTGTTTTTISVSTGILWEEVPI